MSHTEGKFHIQEGIMTHTILDEKDNVIAFTNTFNPNRFMDFERLAACWNACEGISTEYLETNDTVISSFREAYAEIITQLDKRTQERDTAADVLELAIAERDKEREIKRELLEACKGLSKLCANDRIKRAIAKAEGEE